MSSNTMNQPFEALVVNEQQQQQQQSLFQDFCNGAGYSTDTAASPLTSYVQQQEASAPVQGQGQGIVDMMGMPFASAKNISASISNSTNNDSNDFESLFGLMRQVTPTVLPVPPTVQLAAQMQQQQQQQQQQQLQPDLRLAVVQQPKELTLQQIQTAVLAANHPMHQQQSLVVQQQHQTLEQLRLQQINRTQQQLPLEPVQQQQQQQMQPITESSFQQMRQIQQQMQMKQPVVQQQQQQQPMAATVQPPPVPQQPRLEQLPVQQIHQMHQVQHDQAQEHDARQEQRLEDIIGDAFISSSSGNGVPSAATTTATATAWTHTQSQQSQQHVQKKRRVTAPPALKSPSSQEQAEADLAKSLLHRSCQQFPRNLMILRAALRQDPSAARRMLSIPVAVCASASEEEEDSAATPIRASRRHHRSAARSKFVAIPTLLRSSSLPRKESYQIPINIALHHGASTEVLELLLAAAPDMLLVKDGPSHNNSVCTLHVALTCRPWNDDGFLTQILQAQPNAAHWTDRRLNAPLHLAVQNAKTQIRRGGGITLAFLSRLYQANPEAVAMRNMHNETPYIIAQRNSLCPEAIVNFLRSVSY